MEHLRFGWRNWRIPWGLQKVLRVVLFTLERKGEVEKKFGGFWGRKMSFWRNRGSFVLTKLTSRMMCSIRRATCNMSQNSSRYWTNGRFLGNDQYRDSKAEHVWDCNHLLKYSPQSLCYVLHKPIPQFFFFSRHVESGLTQPIAKLIKRKATAMHHQGCPYSSAATWKEAVVPP